MTVPVETGTPMNQPYQTTHDNNDSFHADTTHVKDDGLATTVVTGDESNNAYKRLLGLHSQDQDQSIASFLMKPIRLQSSTISNTDVLTTLLYDGIMPKTYFTTSALPADKVRGLFGSRFTMVMTLQINATRFQQGRYMLYWVPFGGVRGQSDKTVAWVNSHTGRLQSRTQLPHVEIDISTQTSVQLKIPFSSVNTCWPTGAISDVNDFGALGQLRLVPYMPLRAGSGDISANYTLWMHLEDFEPYGNVVPQAGVTVTKKRYAKNASEMEQQEAGVGPIGGMLAKVSKASSILSPIPIVGQYASGVSWATDVLSRAANVFGWAKPINLAPTHRYYTETSCNLTTVDGIDNSNSLSLTSANKVTDLVGFSNKKEDDMTIAAIAMRPAYTYGFQWPDTASSGDVLSVVQIKPHDFLESVSTGGRDYFFLTPLQFCSQMFDYWRGSLQYTFKIAKTEFHSGRIVVAFSPENKKSTFSVATLTSSDFIYREIIDLRHCNEFTVTVPYMGTSLYKSTWTDTLIDLDDKVGALFVFVLDPLVAPDTVSSTLDFVVEVSGGPDIEFAVPTSRITMNPAHNVTPQSGWLSSEPSANDTEVVDIGNSKVGPPILDFAEASIGERIVSFRALLRRSNVVTYTDQPYTGKIYWTINPHFWNSRNVTSPTDFVSTDLHSVLSSVYLYARGGLRYKILTTSLIKETNPVNDQYWYAQLATNSYPVSKHITMAANFTSTGNNTNQPMSTSNYYIAHSTDRKMLEVAVPMYSSEMMINTIDCMVGDTLIPDSLNRDSVAPKYAINVSCNRVWATTELPNTILKATSDDFTFGGFVGIPVLQLTKTYVVPTPP